MKTNKQNSERQDLNRSLPSAVSIPVEVKTIPVEFNTEKPSTWEVPIRYTRSGLNGLERLEVIRQSLRHSNSPEASPLEKERAVLLLSQMVYDYAIMHVETDLREDMTQETMVYLHRKAGSQIESFGIDLTARKVHGALRDRYKEIMRSRERAERYMNTVRMDAETAPVFPAPAEEPGSRVRAVQEKLRTEYVHGEKLAQLTGLLGYGLRDAEIAGELEMPTSTYGRHKEAMEHVIRTVWNEEVPEQRYPLAPTETPNKWARKILKRVS